MFYCILVQIFYQLVDLYNTRKVIGSENSRTIAGHIAIFMEYCLFPICRHHSIHVRCQKNWFHSITLYISMQIAGCRTCCCRPVIFFQFHTDFFEKGNDVVCHVSFFQGRRIYGCQFCKVVFYFLYFYHVIQAFPIILNPMSMRSRIVVLP